MKRFLIALGIVVLLALAAFLARDALRQTLTDWTGEEDFGYQLKGLGYLALSAVQPARDTRDFAPMRYADVNPFGVNTFLEQEVEEAKVRQSLQLIREAGFHWIRQEFPWEDIEKPGKGQYWDTQYNKSTWDKYDRIVALARGYGVEIVARLDHPPAWTRHDGRARGDFVPPDNFDDYGDFVATVVERYRGKIRFYQLWNEPNIYPEWGEQPVNANDYVRLLKVGYTRAKAADSNVVIISAGLAQTIERGPKNVSDLIFLQQMYDAGVRGYFDILAVMNYGLWTGPGDRRVEPERTNFSRPILIREIMVKNGDADKPIWAMEVGWNAVPDNLTPVYGRVTEERQARYAVQAYERARDEWPWMGPMMYWYFKRAYDTERTQPFFYFRMFDPDFTPRPVYAALKDYIANARVMGVGYHQESHWTIDWRGDWQARQAANAVLGEYKAGQIGDALSFTFRGSDLDLVVLQNPYGGEISVQIDDAPARAIELWRTDPLIGGRVNLARDLPDENHRVEIRVLQAPVMIDGIVVQRGNGWLAQRVGMIGLLGNLVLGVLLIASRRIAHVVRT